MKSFSLYVDKKTVIHNTDPISKLCFIGFVVLLPVILPDVRVSFACVLFGFLLLNLAGVLKNALPAYAFASFVLFTVVLIQGMFGVNNETLVLNIFGLRFYREGLLTSLKIILRVFNIIQAFLLLVLTTKPAELVDSLVEKGLSPRIGYVVISVFQIIPQMMATVGTITDAQRSRGMETEGSLFVRAKAFIPLLAPVVLSSFMNTKERAMALEARCFGALGKRTAIEPPRAYKHGSAIRAVLAVTLAIAVLWRIVA